MAGDTPDAPVRYGADVRLRPPTVRPATELLAEWESLRNYERVDTAWGHYEHVLRRLARAEQALAEIEALHVPNGWEFCHCCKVSFPCRTVAALRAPQGDSDD